MRRLLDRIVSPFGLMVVKRQEDELVYHHIYSGGYAEYRATQVKHNKRKLERVWADRTTLSAIVQDLKRHELGRSGICHGARNGFEVAWFREHLGGEVIGTDISETAHEFKHLHVWDFHDVNRDWEKRFEFVYTNSFDQALDPARALKVWAKQIVPHGRIYVEHTMAHSAKHASAMDPFGAHPIAMPYLFFVWGRGCFELTDILEIESKANNGLPAWVFVLSFIPGPHAELPSGGNP